MANIDISELNISGSDLFDDTETYLQELSEEELGIQGGIIDGCIPPLLPTPLTTDGMSTYVCSNCISITGSPLCVPPTANTAN
ncbi:hypothetical protein [Pseudanabaena sp. PCC 6802]|uniref:hypothetical protein n=1 Tax=Pseudanabaena sp. PCC 6802 TaxID=118173 RepID=UPI000348BE4F|nr:hypothetical protein [Pseudanabaena sp. PCC 6802]